MKKWMLLLLFAFTSSLIWAQRTQDVVYLKNGSIIKGQITEYTQGEDGKIKIQTSDGSLLVYPSGEVVKFEKENAPKPMAIPDEVNLDDYGGTSLSYGVAIGGGGLVGVPLQIHPSYMTALELGAYYRPIVVIDQFDEADFKGSFMLAGGANFYFRKHYKARKDKVKLNGIGLKAGRSFGDFAQSFLALNWASEGFRKENEKQSFVLELGLGVVNSHFSNEVLFQYDDPGTQPLLYWKVHWNWYGK